MTFTELLAQASSLPQVQGKIPQTKTIVVGAMGGSAIAAEALTFLTDTYDLVVHRDYGLPRKHQEDALYIAMSYSGNTEETLHFAHAALEKGYRLAVVASGGQLLQFARTYNLPYVAIQAGIVPRNAYMFLVRGFLSLIGEKGLLDALARVQLKESKVMEEAEDDAHFLVHGVPLFYTSNRNALIGSLATLIMDESARTPTFRNTFPEMNHNELQAFDRDMPGGLMHLFRMMLVQDETDGPRIVRRMHVFGKLMKDRAQSVRVVHLSSSNRAEALVSLWIRFIFAARMLAETRGIDPDTQPLVDEFKTLL